MKRIQRNEGGNKAEEKVVKLTIKTPAMQAHDELNAEARQAREQALKENPYTTFDDSEHWSHESAPCNKEGEALLRTEYDASKFTSGGGGCSELAAIALSSCYKHLTADVTFDNATCDLSALYNLIKHNPHFKPEIKAIKAIVEGEAVMDEFLTKVGNL